MSTVQELIDIVMEQKEGSTQAEVALAGLGSEAFPAIARAMEEAPGPRALRLAPVIHEMMDDALVPLLLKALASKSAPLSAAAGMRLTELRDRRAVPVFIAELAELAFGSGAWSLGEIGDAAALPALTDKLHAVLGDSRDREAILRAAATRSDLVLQATAEVVIALAKLGSHEGAAHAAALLDSELSTRVRRSAARALCSALGPETLPALRSASRSSDEGIRWDVADALYFLGTKPAIAVLLEMAQAGGPADRVVARTLALFSDLTGFVSDEDDEDELDPTVFAEWWSGAERSYAGGVVYRRGAPLDIRELIPELAGWRSEEICDQLRLFTGMRLPAGSRLRGRIPKETLVADASAWWNGNGARFEPGGCYRYGRRVRLDNGPSADGVS